MFFTWLFLTILGVALTFMSLLLDIGIGHGDPGWLPFLVGTATLIVPFLVADRMKQSKENRYKDIADGKEPGEAIPLYEPPPVAARTLFTADAFAVLALISLPIGFVIWGSSTPSKSVEGHTEDGVQAELDKPSPRRARKGPRKPPTPALVPAEVPATQVKEDEPSEDEVPDADPDDDGLTEQERKLEEYLEHLEAIDDPNVDELTMLGEMAFDANEAEAAYDHYLEVIEEHTDHSLAPFALYKLAWAEYNLGDVDAAIDDMELMIEWSGRGKLADHGAADLELFTGERQYKSPHSPGG
jgi:hypothetical protein